MKLTMKRNDYQAMLDEALRQAPREACGLIAGTVAENGDRTVEKVYILTNTDHSEEHFTLDPREQLAAVKDMRTHGWTQLGNWHSHPASPSRPSEEDKRLAYDSRASYLILSLAEPGNPALKSFHVEGGEAREEPLEILGNVR